MVQRNYSLSAIPLAGMTSQTVAFLSDRRIFLQTLASLFSQKTHEVYIFLATHLQNHTKITQEKRLCFPPSLLKTFISHRIPIHHENTKQQAFDISLSKISEGNCSHSPWIKHLKFYIINILIYTTEFYQMSICSFGEEKLLEQKFPWALINIL